MEKTSSSIQDELERDTLTENETDFNFDEIDDDLENLENDELVQQALHRGVDLKKYGRELEKDLRNAENESILQYVENNQQVIELHKQMQDCDAVLARMQDMLLGFQADLGGISEEIKHLQDESMSMSVRLKNRKAAEDLLSDFIDRSTLPIELVEAIASPDINDDFLRGVVTLINKLKYLQQQNTKSKQYIASIFTDDDTDNSNGVDNKTPISLTSVVVPSETFTGKSLLPELEKLKMKALSKCKDYFTRKFQELRKPKTNIQVLQQSSLLKYSKLLLFVQMEAPSIGEELRNMYIESMSRTIHSLFKAYSSQLLKLDLVIVTKYDLLCVEEATLKSVFTQKVNLTKRADTFALAERDRILDQIESEPILIHVAVAENQKYYFETILRSIIKHLSDAATSEFLFILDFFSSNARDTFNKIFGRTFSLVLEYLENYLLNCYDAISLLLMIKITYAQRLVMQRRKIPVLDSFFDRLSLLLWPRLKLVIESNLRSIKGANPSKLGPIELTPHFVCRRYAELVVSILTLQRSATYTGSGDRAVSLSNMQMSDSTSSNSNISGSGGLGGGGDNMLTNDLHQLRIEMVNLMERMSSLIPSPKDRTVFLINNYDAILTVIQERRIVCEESQKFEEYLLQQRELFAEEEIRTSFPKLISFVLQTEKLMTDNNKSGGISAQTVDESMVESIVREFAANWRTGIQQINDGVLSHFANFRNGMEILKQVLTQLLLYYTRFQDIIKKLFPGKQPSFVRDIVNTATILMEIKRYSRAF